MLAAARLRDRLDPQPLQHDRRGDDRAHARGDGQPVPHHHRPSDRPPAALARPVRARPRRGDREGGGDRRGAGDQRGPASAGPRLAGARSGCARGASWSPSAPTRTASPASATWSTASASRGKAGWARPTSSTRCPAEEFTHVAPGAGVPVRAPQARRASRRDARRGSAGPGSSSSVCTRRYPDAALRARPSRRLPAPRRHDPVGPVHRCPGEHGDAGPLRPLPQARGACPSRPRRGGGDHPVHRVLPQQGAQPDRDGAGARGGPSRRGAANAWRSSGCCRGSVGRRRTSSSETPTESTRGSRWTPTSPGSRDCSVSPGTTTR